MSEQTVHDGVFLISKADMKAYYEEYHPQVLRFDKNTDACGFQAVNFGACKGETFDRVMILPNGPLQKFLLKNVKLGSPEKYYVAVTRPRYSIAIVMEKVPDSLAGYMSEEIETEKGRIKALKLAVGNM